MEYLNDIIYRIISNNSKNKMITFDFKFGSKEFCYCFNNKITEINLLSNEKDEFLKSVDAVKKLWEAAIKIDPDLNR